MSKNFYKQSQTEPNLRNEFSNTFDGLFPETAKKQKFVLRIMRSDTNSNLIKCSCVDKLTGEPDKDTFCPICFGEGFLWDEIFADGYKVMIRSSVGLSTKQELFSAGLTNIPLVSIFFRYDIPLNIINDQFPDKVVEIMRDLEGNIIRPYKRQRIYRIGTAIDFRSDHGKVEYYKIDCFGEQVKFLNGSKG